MLLLLELLAMLSLRSLTTASVSFYPDDQDQVVGIHVTSASTALQPCGGHVLYLPWNSGSSDRRDTSHFPNHTLEQSPQPEALPNDLCLNSTIPSPARTTLTHKRSSSSNSKTISGIKLSEKSL